MFFSRFDFARVALLCLSLGQTYFFTEANQDGYDKCLFFRTISSMHLPSKWDPFLGPYRQINDSESVYSDVLNKHSRNNMGKRSLSTLAKNDDMPTTHFQDGPNNRESGEVSLRFDDADKSGPSKVSKYLQHVKRRSDSVQKADDESSNVKIFTEDYILCNNDNDNSSPTETYENLKNINDLLQQAEVYCDHKQIYNDKDKINLSFNCVIKRYPRYEAQNDDRLAALKEKFQDADFLSLVLNGLNSEQLAPTTQSFYPRVDKRFMGRIPEMGPRLTTPPTRRHGR